MLTAAEFPDSADFHKAGTSVNDMGGVSTGFAKQFTARCRITETPMGEAVQGAGALAGVTRATLMMPSSTDADKIDAGWRCVARGENWNVKAVARVSSVQRYGHLLAILLERGAAA